MIRVLLALALTMLPALLAGQTRPYPPAREGDFVLHNYRFVSGETLPTLRLHYATLGQPRRDSSGRVVNAVLVLHGTGGSSRNFLNARFAGVLFGRGELLDASRYYVILPDDVGHGRSSKPSDGLRTRFPHYTYTDMVRLEHALVSRGLDINHLRLVMGTSMGCMHSWMWGEMYPNFVDGLVPLACLPEPIAGRNRIMRDLIRDAIVNDPGYDGGNYHREPPGLLIARQFEWIMVSAPRYWRRLAPTGAAADAMLARFDQRVDASMANGELDANDLLYAFAASRDYNPAPRLGTIRARVLAINSADDFVNPPGLDIMPRDIARVRHGKFVLLPVTDQTRGHGTHSLPAIWQGDLGRFLGTLRPPA